MTDHAADLLAHARRCREHGSLTAAAQVLDRVRRLLAIEAKRRRPRQTLTLRRKP